METNKSQGLDAKVEKIPGRVPTDYKRFLKYIKTLEELGLIKRPSYNIEPSLGGVIPSLSKKPQQSYPSTQNQI